jgi:hypothetical protein
MVQARFGGDNETRWYGESNLGHLAEIGAFSPQERFVFSIPFTKIVHKLSVFHDDLLY